MRREKGLDMENLDEELEKFLDGPEVDHNFAINKAGEKVVA